MVDTIEITSSFFLLYFLFGQNCYVTENGTVKKTQNLKSNCAMFAQIWYFFRVDRRKSFCLLKSDQAELRA